MSADRNPAFLPPRSLETFGVSGLLGEKCKVFYYNMFSPNHVGRVSDLLAARLRDAGPGYDELHLRALLLFSVFEGYSHESRASAVPGILTRPITIECGIDEEKLAIGFGFELDSGQEFPDPEQFISDLRRHCDQITVRFQKSTRRIEIVSVVGVRGRVASTENAVATVEVVLIPDPPLADAPPAGEYTELGDLDYGLLLNADAKPAKGKDEADDSQRRVTGRDDDEDELVRIRGTTDRLGGDKTTLVVKGGSAEQGDDEIRISGGASGEDDAPARGWKGLLQKVWPFSNAKTEQDSKTDDVEDSELLSIESLNEGDAATEGGGENAPGPELAPAVEGPPANPEATARSLMIELQGGNLDRTIVKAKKEMLELRKEIQGKRTQRWAEGLMSELVGEKARLQEMARKLNTAVRQKEVEFRNKEMGLKEEIRRRDDTLRQKENSIARTKDQVQQLRMTLERMKAVQVGAGDDVHYRQKFNLTQKLYIASKDENSKMVAQIEQMKNEATSLRYAAKKADEYKKQYLALVDRTAEGKTGGLVANATKRADTEAKMAAVYKKEAGDLRARVSEFQLKMDESEREEARLKREIAQLQAELNAVKVPDDGSKPGNAA